MTDTQVKVAPPLNWWQRIIRRIFSFLLFAAIIGCIVNATIRVSNKSSGPAGFGRGVLHGALMPAALPNLIVGNDVSIYAPNNTGRTYKLGYTIGVNGCGAIFFGVFFLRLRRWRKQAKRGM
jgi:hypothetical protein